jgi:hypothetical protein
MSEIVWEESVGRWVMHRPSRTISKITAFYSGDELSVYTNPSGQEVKGPVVVLEDGNAFCASQNSFVLLAESQAEFYRNACQIVADVAKEMAIYAASVRMPQEMFETLFGAVLSGQLRALSTGKARPEDVV